LLCLQKALSLFSQVSLSFHLFSRLSLTCVFACIGYTGRRQCCAECSMSCTHSNDRRTVREPSAGASTPGPSQSESSLLHSSMLIALVFVCWHRRRLSSSMSVHVVLTTPRLPATMYATRPVSCEHTCISSTCMHTAPACHSV
jgi:hypothetical protein